MKKYLKRSIIIPLILFLYTTITALWFLPHNNDMNTSEKVFMITFSYLIIAALHFVLKRREKRRENTLAQMKGNKKE